MTSEQRAEYGYCGARKRNGDRCKQTAGWGTDHPGTGACKNHGGNTRSHVVKAARVAAATLGEELDLEPHEALLQCVHSAAGLVAYTRAKVTALEDGAVVVEHVKERVADGDARGGSYIERSNQAELHIWVRAYHDDLDRLARFSKMALDAGVEERRVRAAERFADSFATALQGILGDLALTPEQQKRAPEIVRRHLIVLEGGQAA